MGRVLAALPKRAVELAAEWAMARSGLLDLLNREIMPMLSLLRSAVNGPLAATDVKTESYTLKLDDELILMNDSGALGIEAVLPMSAPVGHYAFVANVGAPAVDVAAPTSETVEGGASVALNSGVTSRYIKVSLTEWHRLQ